MKTIMPSEIQTTTLVSWFTDLGKAWQMVVVITAFIGLGIPIGGAIQKGVEVFETIALNNNAIREMEIEFRSLDKRLTDVEREISSIKSDIRLVRADMAQNLCLEIAQVDPTKNWRDCRK